MKDDIEVSYTIRAGIDAIDFTIDPVDKILKSLV